MGWWAQPGQVNVFEKAVLAMKSEGLTVELKNMDWPLLENDRNVCLAPRNAVRLSKETV